jgi:hypothetical protein
MSRSTNAKKTPVGRYAVVCDEIDKEWPDKQRRMTMDVFAGRQPGIYEANFDFRVLEGAMVIGAQEEAVKDYCNNLGEDSEDQD